MWPRSACWPKLRRASGAIVDAENLLARCLELAPGFAAARHNYAMVLHRQNKPEAALAQVELLLADDPRNPGYRNLKAAILGRIGEYAASIEHYRECARGLSEPGQGVDEPGARAQDRGQQRREHRRLSQEHRARAAPRRGVLEPREPQDFPLHAASRRRPCASSSRGGELSADDRFHFEFSLGKALEDAGEYAESFEHYLEGNRLRRR